ncbi:hypothetical protein BDW67DRAFT_178598 [Aspergillus spinulosporus]
MPSLFGPSNDVVQLGPALLCISPLGISFGAFLHPSLRNDAAHPSIGLTYPPATVLCVINGLSRQSRETRTLYFAGALFSIAHFCWGPTMFAILGRIGDVKSPGVRNEDALREWLPRHRTRTLLVNVPAFFASWPLP